MERSFGFRGINSDIFFLSFFFLGGGLFEFLGHLFLGRIEGRQMGGGDWPWGMIVPKNVDFMEIQSY